MLELLVVHLMSHEIPMLILAGISFIFGKRAVFNYVRKHDPAVRELRDAAVDTLPFVGYGAHVPEKHDRLCNAIEAVDGKSPYDHD